MSHTIKNRVLVRNGLALAELAVLRKELAQEREYKDTYKQKLIVAKMEIAQLQGKTKTHYLSTMEGQLNSLESMEQLLQKLGGDFFRAKPLIKKLKENLKHRREFTIKTIRNLDFEN